MNTAIPVTIPIKNIQLNPGSLITIHDVSWEQFEAILEEREAEGIRTRIAYIKGTLEIMSPLLELFPQSVDRAFTEGSSKMLRELRKQMS